MLLQQQHTWHCLQDTSQWELSTESVCQMKVYVQERRQAAMQAAQLPKLESTSGQPQPAVPLQLQKRRQTHSRQHAHRRRKDSCEVCPFSCLEHCSLSQNCARLYMFGYIGLAYNVATECRWKRGLMHEVTMAHLASWQERLHAGHAFLHVSLSPAESLQGCPTC